LKGEQIRVVFAVSPSPDLLHSAPCRPAQNNGVDPKHLMNPRSQKAIFATSPNHWASLPSVSVCKTAGRPDAAQIMVIDLSPRRAETSAASLASPIAKADENYLLDC
jgi:hypothetical protein